MGDTRTTIRLPADLHARVKELAERDRRTVSAEMVWLIERGLQADDAWQQDRKKGARSH